MTTTDFGEDCTNLLMRLSLVADDVVSFVRNRSPCFVIIQVQLSILIPRRGCFNFHDTLHCCTFPNATLIIILARSLARTFSFFFPIFYGFYAVRYQHIIIYLCIYSTLFNNLFIYNIIFLNIQKFNYYFYHCYFLTKLT